MGYDPNKGYAPTATAAPGQGQSAVDAALTDVPANTAGTSSGAAKYLNQNIPGTRTLIESVPGAGVIGQRWTAPKTLGQMQADLYQMGTDNIDGLTALQTLLVKAGLLDPRARQFALGSVSPGDPTDSAYTRLLSEAIKTGGDYNVILNGLASNPRNSRGQRNWTLLQQQQAAAATSGAGRTSSESFSLTDPNAARDLVNTALQNRLGRAANPDEISQFIGSLHASEQANPSRSTETFGGNGLPTSSTSTSTPVDPGSAAKAFATSSQGRANEAGAQSELGFLNVLQGLVGQTRSPV
jgi:hypothetical protein